MVRTSTIIIATVAFSAASSLALPIELDERNHFLREEDVMFAHDKRSPLNFQQLISSWKSNGHPSLPFPEGNSFANRLRGCLHQSPIIKREYAVHAHDKRSPFSFQQWIASRKSGAHLPSQPIPKGNQFHKGLSWGCLFPPPSLSQENAPDNLD